MVLSQQEKAALACYLSNGGFLWVDDFWGDGEWQQLEKSNAGGIAGPRMAGADSGSIRSFTRCSISTEMPQIPAIRVVARCARFNRRI